MNLEDWLCKFDAKKMALDDCKEYLYHYQQEEPDEFHEIFSEKKKDILFVLHSIAYVINIYHEYDSEDGTYKYISVRIRLQYKENTFAEYEVIYGLDGEYHDDYFRII